jgi:hypothetical protein
MIKKYTSMREYLSEKGITFRESNGELITRCIFGNCDADSRGNEAHLYIDRERALYHCKKCDAKGNFITFARHFGDDVSDWSPAEKRPSEGIRKETNTVDVKKIWEASREASADFLYLKKKAVLPHGIRFRENRLVVPLYDSNGSLSSLQFIAADGDKQFLTGATVAGCFFVIGTPQNRLYITEGFATGASVFEATGYAVAVAFSASNLKATAEEMRRQYPKTEVIVCSDTDDSGLKQARAAAAIGMRLAIPKFTDGEMIDGKAPTDFNDLHVLRGYAAVKTAIESAEVVRDKFGFTSLGALLDEPEEETSWIVEELLPSSGFSIIAAKPKVGKSTLARQLALCVAQGASFLGRNTTKGPVLYVALEEKRDEVKKHFKMLGAKGNEDLHSYMGSAPNEASQWLTKEVKSRKPVLVIIDTLFRFARVTDVNDYAKVTAALDPLLALARENAAHLMVIHHARKGGGDGGDSTLGSTAIFGSVDTSIILKKTDGKRTIETQQRYGTDMESTLLVFDEVSKSTVLGGTKEEDDMRRISEEITTFLKTQKEPVGEPIIDEEVKGRTDLKRKALRDLVTKGEVVRNGAGKRGDPFLYSCSLVPSIYAGQEKQETKSTENSDSSSVVSCSQDLATLTQSEQNKLADVEWFEGLP